MCGIRRKRYNLGGWLLINTKQTFNDSNQKKDKRYKNVGQAENRIWFFCFHAHKKNEQQHTNEARSQMGEVKDAHIDTDVSDVMTFTIF